VKPFAIARAYVFAAILLLAIEPLRAEADAATPPSAAPITNPALVSQHLRVVLARDQFQEVAEPPVNTRIEDYLSQWFRSLGARFGEFNNASRMPAFESLLMTLLAAFAVAILVYVMVRLTRRRARMEMERDDVVANQKAFRLPEDYEREIVAAIAAGDWHAAYLTAWRQFLSRLEHRHLVETDRTRTNREYLAQLRAQSLPGTALDLLNRLVDAYDRSIYGRQSISEKEWARFRSEINEASLLLNLDDKAKRAVAGATS
jgi:hypothetical protein